MRLSASETAEMDALTQILNFSTSATSSIDQDAELLSKSSATLESVMSDMNSESGEPLKAVDDQQRVDTLLRALKRLPDSELEMYGIKADGLPESIEPHSEQARRLFKAWQQRQMDLREAIKSMTKPAEIMGNHLKVLASIIPSKAESVDSVEVKATDSDVRHALNELESLVDDVDNARDFHHLGGYRIVSDLLNPLTSISETYRDLAAQILGNAVKNSYDYQLWVLEEDGQTLKYLMDMLQTGGDKSKRKALYALATSTRGNSDVQEAIWRLEQTEDDGQIEQNVMTRSLYSIATSQEATIDLHRKIFAFVSDMLEEYEFIQNQIRNPRDLELDGAIEDEGAAASAGAELLRQLHGLKPLGKSFCTSSWLHLFLETLESNANALTTLTIDTDGLDGQQVKLRAVIENVLEVLLHSHTTCTDWSTMVEENKNWFNSTGITVSSLRSLSTWANLVGPQAGDVLEKATECLLRFQ